MARSVLALVFVGCLVAGAVAQCNPETSTQGEPGAGCDPLMKRTTRKLQEVDTIPGLGAAASGLMQGINGLGNLGNMFGRVGQFFQNLRPAGGAARAARGGSDGATELTPVREPASAGRSTPRPSRSSDRLESGRHSPSDRSSSRPDRSSRLSERRDSNDNDSRDSSRGRRDTISSPRSERGRDRDSSRSDSRSDRRSSSRSDSRSSNDSRGDRRLEAAARAQPATALYAPQFVEVSKERIAINQALEKHEPQDQAAHAAPAAAPRKIGVMPK